MELTNEEKELIEKLRAERLRAAADKNKPLDLNEIKPYMSAETRRKVIDVISRILNAA